MGPLAESWSLTHNVRSHLELLGVDAPRAVGVEQVERLAQLGLLLVGEACFLVGV